MSPRNQPTLMSVRQARGIEYSIIGLCILALVMIFQPFSLPLFSIGAVLVVIGGLAFNLIPLCRPGAPIRSLVRAGVIVLLLLVVISAVAIASAYLYGVYLQPR